MIALVTAMRLAKRQSATSDTVLLYGSCARGDQEPESDIDLLRISKGRAYAAQMEGRISLHTYDIEDLRSAAEEGSLFVLHLLREAKRVQDPRNALADLAAHYRRPATYLGTVRAKLMASLRLLDVGQELFLSQPLSFAGIGTFVGRSALYARAADSGNPTFSMRALAAHEPAATLMSNFKRRERPTFEEFQRIRTVVRRMFGVENASKSISSLGELVTLLGTDPLFDSLVQRLTTPSGMSVYEELALTTSKGRRLARAPTLLNSQLTHV